MVHINPTLPYDGQPTWAGVADAYLVTLRDQINLHDDSLATFTTQSQVDAAIALALANYTASSPSGNLSFVDNGDGTGSVVSNAPPPPPALALVDNGDGTFSIASPTGVVDNGDGTYTTTSGTVTDNGDGTYLVTD